MHRTFWLTKSFCLFCSSFDEERPEVPMLFRDVPSLLIIFVLTMPQPLRKGILPFGCFTTLQESSESYVISSNRGRVQEQSNSHFLSVLPSLIFSCADQRGTTMVVGELHLLYVPFWCVSSILMPAKKGWRAT